jgi:hypothetical protein
VHQLPVVLSFQLSSAELLAASVIYLVRLLIACWLRYDVEWAFEQTVCMELASMHM